MSKMTIKSDDGYTFRINDDYGDYQSSAVGMIMGFLGKKFLEIEKELSELIDSEKLLEYHDGIYLDTMVIGWEGSPSYALSILDDTPQYRAFTMKTQPKIENSPEITVASFTQSMLDPYVSEDEK